MAGKRILDAAKLLETTRAVAQQHLKIRRDQFNIWSETSTLAQTVKAQTDRVTVTLQAARELSRRLDEQGPIWKDEITKRKEELAQQVNAARSTGTEEHDSVDPTIENVSVGVDDGLKESADQAEIDDGSLSALRRRELQRRAESQIPAVGTGTHVPSDAGSDTYNERPEQTSTELSSLPRTKLPKLASSEQGAQESGIDQDVYNTRFTSQEAGTDTPADVNIDVFSTPRVSRMLGQSADSSSNPYAGRRKMPAKPLPEMLAAEQRRKQTEDLQKTTTTAPVDSADADTKDLAKSIANETSATQEPAAEMPAAEAPTAPAYEMRESRVPATRFGRLWQYSGLATSMAFGAVNESLRRFTGSGAEGSLMLSEANMNRLVAKLSRMRGAALKLGQMMSFQDSKVLPPAINTVLQRVQDSADYMPASQRDKVLRSNLGEDWRSLFSSFDEKPFAAASIGQVHKATLASNGKDVAVKVQYPGVRNSIDSDLNNLSLLLTASRLLPRGLYLEKTIANARLELGWECDYIREAEACKRFKDLVSDEQDIFTVPQVYAEASGADVLTAEFMHGKAVTKIPDLTQEDRDWIGTQILRLCLRELMEWRFMQTDPNWTNFLYNKSARKLELLDFGASREFPDKFVEPYVALLIAASKHDREACRDFSIELGYLTGNESQGMLNAHIDSIFTLAEPFTDAAPATYDFKDQTITDRVRANIGLMLRERLAPPPEETYSLHRKLSGAFLLCAKLESRIKTKDMFANAVDVWEKRDSKVVSPS